jgi:hypothetical protein
MGTTVATNALLERKGERVALLITKGFRDVYHFIFIKGIIMKIWNIHFGKFNYKGFENWKSVETKYI